MVIWSISHCEYDLMRGYIWQLSVVLPRKNLPVIHRPVQPQIDERTLREERILDAAATLLARWGYRKTTIDDVAREAGVGKGTIYLHWKDKNDLFRAAIWREQQRYSEETMRRIADDPQGGLLHRITVHGMLAAVSVALDEDRHS